MFDDGEPDAQSAVLAGRRGVRVAEALEHVRQEARSDARARVGDADLEVSGLLPEDHFYGAWAAR